jgi:hypothetical protein
MANLSSMHIYILDTSYQIGQRYHMAMPTPLDCNALPNIKFSEFTSTFLSVLLEGSTINLYTMNVFLYTILHHCFIIIQLQGTILCV